MLFLKVNNVFFFVPFVYLLPSAIHQFGGMRGDKIIKTKREGKEIKLTDRVE